MLKVTEITDRSLVSHSYIHCAAVKYSRMQISDLNTNPYKSGGHVTSLICFLTFVLQVHPNLESLPLASQITINNNLLEDHI